MVTKGVLVGDVKRILNPLQKRKRKKIKSTKSCENQIFEGVGIDESVQTMIVIVSLSRFFKLIYYLIIYPH
jgi:hypothetical protein